MKSIQISSAMVAAMLLLLPVEPQAAMPIAAGMKDGAPDFIETVNGEGWIGAMGWREGAEWLVIAELPSGRGAAPLPVAAMSGADQEVGQSQAEAMSRVDREERLSREGAVLWFVPATVRIALYTVEVGRAPPHTGGTREWP